MISLWEKQSLLSYDVLIIGAGITGLSAAASLKERNANLRITILERGVLPTGASTKNAGFACFGSISELRNDMDTLGEDGMVDLVEKRIKGLEKTVKRLGQDRIDLQVNGGYELIFTDDDLSAEIEKINQLLVDFFKCPIYELAPQKIDPFGFKSTYNLIENKYEGQLDTGKLISTLWDYCSHLGIKIITGCEVLAINDHGTGVEVQTKEMNFTAKKVGICTNAFTRDFLKEKIDLTPGRGMVMSIVPKNKLKLRGTFHYEEGYYYFRDYYGKLIYGGGRNIDKKAEATATFGINQEIKKKLIQDLDQIILPEQKYYIEDIWTGIMAFGKNKTPIIKPVSNNIAIGVRLGGMGVAIGSIVGEQLAKLLVD